MKLSDKQKKFFLELDFVGIDVGEYIEEVDKLGRPATRYLNKADMGRCTSEILIDYSFPWDRSARGGRYWESKYHQLVKEGL